MTQVAAAEAQKIAELIRRRRLQMLVHSHLYYHLDKSLITDWQWGTWASELAKLQQDYPEIARSVIWHDAFEDFDGSTGAFLPIKHPWVVRKAQYLLMLHDTKMKEGKT